jgi:hypothetical protein
MQSRLVTNLKDNRSEISGEKSALQPRLGRSTPTTWLNRVFGSAVIRSETPVVGKR